MGIPLLALACGGAIAADAAPDANPELVRAAKLPKCYERFLVNRCIAQAKDARLEAVGKAGV